MMQAGLLRVLSLACAVAASGADFARAQSAAAEAVFQQGTASLHAGDLNAAGDDFAKAAQLSPVFAEAYLNLGLVREAQRNYPDALPALSKAVALKPMLHGANLFLGIAEYRLNQFDASAAALERETHVSPNDAHAWMWLGIDELAARHLDPAVDALNRAAKLSPDDVDILYHRGRALLLLSKQSYDRMFELDPKSWRVHQVLAQSMAASNRGRDAVEEYRAAITLAPAEPGLHQSLATELWKTAQTGEAAEEYRKELGLDPNNTLARYQLGCLLVEESSGEQGHSLIEEALRQDPSLPNGNYYLARALMQTGDDARAIEYFKRELSEKPDVDYEQQTYYQLARLYRRTHQPEAEASALSRFKQIQDSVHQEQSDALSRRVKLQADALTPSPKPDVPDGADRP